MVVDYADRMVDSIHRLQTIMSQSAHYLLTSSKAFYKPKLENHWFDIDDFRKSWDSLPKQSVIQIDSADEPSKVVLFNSHARRRTEVVSINIKGTIHLRRRQIFTIFDPYPLPSAFQQNAYVL